MARRRRRIPVRWIRWSAILLLPIVVPVVLLNVAVAYFGSSIVFPLSPFFLKNKLSSLAHYALHRPRCVFTGHADLDSAVAKAESKHRLPRGLLAAVVSVESNGRIHRISSAGAMGPAQLTPSTARLLGVSDPFDPEQAIDGSGRYLAMHLATFRRNVRLAVAAYNAGPGAIVDGRVPRNGETEHYVRKVMDLYGESRRRTSGPGRASLARVP